MSPLLRQYASPYVTDGSFRDDPVRGGRWLKGAAGFLVAAMVLAGCGNSTPERPKVTVKPTQEGLATEKFTAPELEWQPCASDSEADNKQVTECATLTVPLNWSDLGRVPGRPDQDGVNPETDGKTITLAMKRRLATTQEGKLGTLLINPGGPGSSGTDLVDSVGISFGDKVLEHFDVLGWAPRGVRTSSAVECLNDQERDAQRIETFDMSTDEGFAAAEASRARFTKSCVENSGDLLGYVDTASSAMDMEAIRIALKTEQTDYLGFSYGTLLGATYAGIFPQRVGRFVLDGALDPSASYQDLGLAQAEGFEKALHAYVTNCQKDKKCPLSGSAEDGVQQIRDLFTGLQSNQMPSGDKARPLTEGDAMSAVILAMYDDKNLWPYLTTALSDAIERKDGRKLLFMADLSADRDENGVYQSNSDSAFTAINCLDYPMLEGKDAMRADEEELVKVSPTFGAALAFGALSCSGWPYPPTRTPTEITATGAAPILVIGTTNDPATPYKFSEELARQLDQATLLTYEGEGHTAYSRTRSNSCVVDAVDGYLVEGIMPAEGTRC